MWQMAQPLPCTKPRSITYRCAYLVTEGDNRDSPKEEFSKQKSEGKVFWQKEDVFPVTTPEELKERQEMSR